jgi:hypothetical protein
MRSYTKRFKRTFCPVSCSVAAFQAGSLGDDRVYKRYASWKLGEVSLTRDGDRKIKIVIARKIKNGRSKS